ncbi:peptidoglycan DD-metalloendopeptidase family protein [Methyloraptor flagellatus]|uniref:Peptidoglycan DD-metalloendopeptidase family protein n=1 Tax=Methyloraptor flagellatus TaxID=3162530 RepID=A0AAU7XFN8_9HYPH
MRQLKNRWRSHNLTQVALVALLSAGAAGCSSDFSRFGEPVYTGSTPNQKSILGGAPAQPAYGGGYAQPGYAQPAYPPQSDVTGSVGVQRQQLPPPVAAPAAPAPVAPAPYVPQQQSYAPPPPAVPQTTGSIGSRPIVASAPAGWTMQGATPVAVQAGDTADAVARRYGVPATVLIQSNGLSDPNRLVPGQQLLIPVYTSNAPAVQAPAQRTVTAPVVQPAPVPQRAAAAPVAAPVAIQPGAKPAAHLLAGAKPQAPTPALANAPAAQPIAIVAQHTVVRGETLDAIAKHYGVTKHALMQRNGLKAEAVAAGQRLTLPAGAKVTVRTAQAPVAAPLAPALTPAAGAPPAALGQTAQLAPAKPGPITPAPVTPVATAPVPKPGEVKVASTAPTAPAKQEAAVAREITETESHAAKNGPLSFRWPVRGRVIGEFGAKPGGERNDGINLAVPEGTSVKAAEDGEVIYAGNELKGYGNLVLVRHADGWVSAYAHASDILVNRGDKVNRGQIIARAGTTGNVNQPQLHFELRKGQKPVDPKPYLASN